MYPPCYAPTAAVTRDLRHLARRRLYRRQWGLKPGRRYVLTAPAARDRRRPGQLADVRQYRTAARRCSINEGTSPAAVVVFFVRFYAVTHSLWKRGKRVSVFVVRAVASVAWKAFKGDMKTHYNPVFLCVSFCFESSSLWQPTPLHPNHERRFF